MIADLYSIRTTFKVGRARSAPFAVSRASPLSWPRGRIIIDSVSQFPGMTGTSICEMAPGWLTGRCRPTYEHVEAELHSVNAKWDSDNESDLTKAIDQQPKKTYYRGPRLAMYGAASVLLLNIILMVTALVYAFAFLKHRLSSFSTAVLYEGSCSTASRSEMGLHFFINVLSTGLLAASNYCMQYLNAPTRQDVDWAHAKGLQLRIGTQGFHNFLVMRKHSIVMWIALLLTSLPIHLLYNSAIYSTKALYPRNSFPILLGPSGFSPTSMNMQSSSWKNCVASAMPQKLRNSEYISGLANSHYERLTVGECIEIYSYNMDQEYLTHNGMMVMLSKEMPNSERDLFVLRQTDIDSLRYHPSPQRIRFLGLPAVTRSYNVTDMHGKMTPGSNATETACADNTFMDICSDFSTLELIMRFEPQNLEAALHDPVHWRNSSWAAEVDVRQGPLTCETPSIKFPASMSTLLDDYEVKDQGYFLKYSYSVDGCLSMRTKEHCQVLLNPPICLIVVACCAIKTACAYLTSRTQPEELLLTAGDAIASFLSSPDGQGTDDQCLKLSRDISFPREVLRGKMRSVAKLSPSMPRFKRRRRWMASVPIQRWLITVSLFLFYIGFATALMCERLPFLSSIDNNSFGKIVESDTPLRNEQGKNFGTARSILLANTPQLFISLTYYYYNSIFTGMLSAAEYSSYGVQKKPLRVTNPVGSQKSTYWLSIPYRYGIPICVLFSILHWLVSQTVFYMPQVPYMPTSSDGAVSQYEHTISFGNSDYFNSNEPLTPDDFQAYYSNSCLYSNYGALASLSMFFLLILFLLLLGFRRFKSDIPVTRSRSAAISVACHPPETDKNAALKPVKWRRIGPKSQVRDSAGSDTAFLDARYTFTSLDDAD